MEYAAKYDIARKTQLPRPVAILELAQISEVVCRWQPDLRHRRHPEERAGPDKAIAHAMIQACIQRRTVDARGRHYQRPMIGFVALGRYPTRQEAYLFPFREWKTLKKSEKIFERVGFWD